MKKIFSKIFGLLCTFTFLFCSAGCSIIPGWTFGTGSDDLNLPDGGDTNNNGSGGTIADGPDPEFVKGDEGNWSYYSDYIDSYDGVRILSVPPADDVTGNANTDNERARFYTNVSAQFEILSEYSLYYLLGQYGGGISDTPITSVDSDYSTRIESISPEVRNLNTYDTNAYMIERVITGWNYDGTTLSPVYSTAYQWTLNLESYDIDNGNAQDYASEYVETYKLYVQIRLMEIVLNDLYGANITPTTYGYASEPQNAKNRINEYVDEFDKLGFDIGTLEDTNSVATDIKEFILNDIIGATALAYADDVNNGNISYSEPTFAEEYTDENASGSYDDGEPFVDLNDSGTYDSLYYDINGNGQYDVNFASDNGSFYAGYITKVDNLVTNMTYIVKGEEGDEFEFTDSNGNGHFDEGFIDIYAMEVQDLTSTEYFTPGVEATDTTVRRLNNMDYAQYQSVLFMPSATTKFDSFTIYVDSETNFSMLVWLRVHTNGTTFTVPVCILNLNSEEDCDWTNEETQTDLDWENMDSWTDPEQLLNDEERNSVWDLDLSAVLTDEQYSLISETGVDSYDGELDYNGRYDETTKIGYGYHTNSVDNTALADLYNLLPFTYNDEESKNFVSSSDDTYFKFIFQILDEQPDQEYNFKFLIMPDFWDLNNTDDE